MKTWITLSIALLALSGLAYLVSPFPGYDELEDRSPDIIIVRCTTNAPPPFPRNKTINDIDTLAAEIVTTLKGTNSPGPITLNSLHWLNQGDDYLVIGNCADGVCEAIEDYRVIPLGRELWAGDITNAIANKPMNEQLQILFKRSINHLNQEIQRDQQEKQRLEEDLPQ